jgi:uncharacterized protein (DUF1015 family)
MAEVKAFKALRYNDSLKGVLPNLVTPPYDIIPPKAQVGYYEKNEKNVIRLEYGLGFDNDNEFENKYTRAKKTLNEWLADNTLMQDKEEAYYIYEQIFSVNGETKAFKGVFSRVRIEEFSKQVVLPHEETLSKAKTDRYSLMCETNCNFSPIYLLYLDEEKNIVKIIDENSKGKPTISFISEDGITQNIWVVTDQKQILAIEQGFKNKQLFIADGHHRYETALNFRNKMRDENPNWAENDGFNFVMSFLVEMDNDGLLVFPTHRMLKNLSNFCEDDIAEKLKDEFIVEKIDNTDIENGIYDPENKVFGFYTGKNYYYKVTLKDFSAMSKYLPEKSSYYRNLDVSILHTMILEKYFGIDKENMANQTNLYYTRSYNEAIDSVSNGEYQCSFIINATKIREIKDVSLNKEKMPQKSTYFWPKLVTGIVMNKLK